jgi:electron transfer flavoprotein beta subunit
MQNMRGILPALQKAAPAPIASVGLRFGEVEVPRQKRETRIVKDAPVDEIAREIVEWIRGR